ncbi:MAG TPA: GDP-L-fucose synthase [Micropepsaceae bacterium]|nr:GDP-L-fucose synthase [Micropepsaceae bacterium]
MSDAPVPYQIAGKRVWVAGHKGMVGSALLRRLAWENCTILTAARNEADLRRPSEVEAFMTKVRPQVVFLAAARVGGIVANDSMPASFLYDNLMIAANVIEAARLSGVEKLLNLGSTCVYPKFAPQPIPEDALLTGPLEPTNQWYAIAKIAAIKLCDAYRRQHGCDFISAMPTNLYGPNDNFDLEASHVIPALIAKMAQAKDEGRKDVVLWGTGTPRREFLHVDDCADGLVHLVVHFSGEGPVNVGTGQDVTIRELAETIARIVGFSGRLIFDPSRPDGTPRKLTDVTKLHGLGWTAHIPLAEGLEQTYRWFRENRSSLRRAGLDSHAVEAGG